MGLDRNVIQRCRSIVVCAQLAMAVVLFLAIAPLRAQDHSAHEGHEGMAMDSSAPEPSPAKLLADKRESEFNHHLAGFFVVLAGIFILAEGRLSARWPGVRYAWPLCFLLAGIFVLVFSDTELWPFGPQSWAYGLSHHAEVRQHKSFAVILLGLGVIEILRARGSLKAAWAGWVFPILAIAGSVILHVPRAHRRHARCRTHGTHGAYPDSTPQLHDGRIWYWLDQRLVRNQNKLAGSVCQALALHHDYSGRAVDVLRGVTALH